MIPGWLLCTIYPLMISPNNIVGLVQAGLMTLCQRLRIFFVRWILQRKSKEIDQRLHQIIWDNHAWTNQMTEEESPAPCLHEDANNNTRASLP